MEGKFPSKILAFVTVITHNCDSFFCWSQIFHILSSICEGLILPSQIRFFERAFWVSHKFLVANRHFFCSVLNKIWAGCGSVCLFGRWLLMMWPFGVVLLTYVSTRMLFALRCTTVLYTQPLAQECFLHFHRHMDIDTLHYYLGSYFLDHLGFSRFYHKRSLILYLVGETNFARIR